MKILIDARPLQTYSKFRGIGRYVRGLIDIFNDDPSYYFLFFKGKNFEKKIINKIVINSPRKGITFTDKYLIPKILKEGKFDVYHSTSFAIPDKIDGVKSIITLFDITPLLFPQFSKKKNIYVFKKILKSAKKADKILTISQKTRDDLVKFENFPENKMDVVYPPVDIKSKVIKTEFLNIDIPEKYIFYAGGFDGNKNVETLMKALNIFKKPVVITGKIDKKSKERLIKLVNRDTRGLLFFTGYISDRELSLLYKNSVLFVFPSLYEGFGYPPVEALKYGTPSVISREGSLKEVMKDSAVYLNNPLDETEFAEKIVLLWDDEKIRKNLVKKGQKVIQDYSFEKFKEKMENIYKSVSGNYD